MLHDGLAVLGDSLGVVLVTTVKFVNVLHFDLINSDCPKSGDAILNITVVLQGPILLI